MYLNPGRVSSMMGTCSARDTDALEASRVTTEDPALETAVASDALPVLPLRDVVVYPHMVIPLFVGREKSILALEQAMKVNKQILLLAQKQADVDDPQPKDLYQVGTIATILQLLKLPDGTVKVLVEGTERASVAALTAGDYFAAQVAPLGDTEQYEEREMDVLVRSVVSQFEQYVKLNRKVPPEILTSLAGIEQPGRLADTVAAHMSLKLDAKQKVLEIQDVRRRLEHILALIEGEMDVLQIEKRIRGRVKQQMEKSQREYYLNEQMKAIQKELGEMDDAPNEIAELEKRIARAGMPKEAQGQGKLRAREAQAHVADVGRGDRRTQLHRLAGEGPVEEAHQGQARHRCGRAGAERRPLRPRQGKGADRRIPGRPATRADAEGAYPVPRRAARRRQDVPRAEHRAGDQPQVRPHVARRRA